MWSAGRRLPARVAQQPQLAAFNGLAAPVAAGRTALIGHKLGLQQRLAAPLHHHNQVRTFFGLKDLLFGDGAKKDAKDATSAEDAGVSPTANQTGEPITVGAVIAGEPSASVGAAATKQIETIVGSTDSIHYSVGKYARLADAAIMSTRGKSVVLTTAVSIASGPNARRKDFLPLMVDYRIKFHAVGLIPDTAKRSEMTNSDEEILQSRIIDRVIRPLFPRDFVDDTQVIATVHSLDPANDPLVLAVNSTSAAIAVSDIPWNGPVGCVRVVEINGQLVANPTSAQRDVATMDVLYAANATRVLMIEANGEQISEDRMAEALQFAHEAIAPIIDQQNELVKQHGKPKRTYVRTIVPDDVFARAKEIGLPAVTQLLSTPKYTKAERHSGERDTYDAIMTTLRSEFAGRADADETVLQLAAHDVFQSVLREKILTGDRNTRFDGRGATTIRGLGIETDVLPMAHGSSVFSRGDTQALCSVTLGPLDRGMRLRTALQNPNEAEYKHAILHYEFPPYCVNETGRMGGVNRRMVGHGALAEKAIVPVIPSTDEFPYTIRMTSETMGSDGSSSMATVCGVTMALLDAGVPVKAPVAGISIGLITEGDPFDGNKPIDKYRLITDILGTEDHYGDMDFKIAGTDKGITAIQLDVKLPGVPLEILCEGIHHAKKARSFILKRMTSVMPAPRDQLKSSTQSGGSGAIHVGVKFMIPTGAIGALIGTGGSNVREIESATGCNVSIDRRSGEIHLVGPSDSIDAAKALILEQTASGNSFYKAGDKYEMRVTEVMDFGAILESTAPTKNRGFVHITELAYNRVENIHDVIKVGQVMEFACIMEGVSGKMSRKALLTPPPGYEAPPTPAATSSSSSSSYQSSNSSYQKRPTSGGPKRRGPPGARTGGSSTHRRSASPHKHAKEY